MLRRTFTTLGLTLLLAVPASPAGGARRVPDDGEGRPAGDPRRRDLHGSGGVDDDDEGSMVVLDPPEPTRTSPSWT